MATYDLIIVGGGVTGFALALSLARKTALSIAVLEAGILTAPVTTAPFSVSRVSALTLRSMHFFQSLACWDDIRATASPFTAIECFDERARLLTFSSEEQTSPLGFIVENTVLRAILLEKLNAFQSVTVMPQVVLSAIEEEPDQLHLTLQDGRRLQATLVVAADGKQSFVRKAFGIPVRVFDYKEHAIIGTMQLDAAHAFVARQVFLKTGPIAALPLMAQDQASLVWSLPSELAEAYLALSEAAFLSQLNQAFAPHLKIKKIGPCALFPLSREMAETALAHRTVLIGDAFHVVHPLAGQGLNMGLLDVASLYEIIEAALLKQEDIGSRTVLRRYERWRKADQLPMMLGIDLIKWCFASRAPLVRQCGQLGVKLLNASPLLKSFVMREATGTRFGLPSAMHPSIS